MAFSVFGGVAGFLLGSYLAQLLFEPRGVAVRRFPSARRSGMPGAAFLLVTVAAFGGMAAGVLAGY
jgi:hypothetical protein